MVRFSVDISDERLFMRVCMCTSARRNMSVKCESAVIFIGVKQRGVAKLSTAVFSSAEPSQVFKSTTSRQIL